MSRSDIDTDGFGQVIASLTVFAPTHLESLERYRRESTERYHIYELGKEGFVESDAEQRAMRLNAVIAELLDPLDEVDSSVLEEQATFVRLFLTFGGGAHTISSATLRQLAAVNATLWINS